MTDSKCYSVNYPVPIPTIIDKTKFSIFSVAYYRFIDMHAFSLHSAHLFLELLDLLQVLQFC
jgi:hypothetical protein